MKEKSTNLILVACEESQTVTKAFREYGHAAYSNDINPCYGGHPEWHIVGDATQVINGNAAFVLQNGDTLIVEGYWSMIIAHPPCTYLTHRSSVHLHNGKHTMDDVARAAEFFMTMLNAPCQHVAVENPAPLKVAKLPKYNQTIQPYQFGAPYSKRVCLWLKGLPPLIPMAGYYTQYAPWLGHCNSTSRRRSKTFDCIADAMAAQWGMYVNQ